MTEGTSSLFTHNVPPSFTITLVSSASMNVFKDNTLVNFKNLLSEEINLQGEWQVAVTEITFPTQINNVTDNIIVYYKKDRVIASMKVEKDKNAQLSFLNRLRPQLTPQTSKTTATKETLTENAAEPQQDQLELLTDDEEMKVERDKDEILEEKNDSQTESILGQLQVLEQKPYLKS